MSDDELKFRLLVLWYNLNMSLAQYSFLKPALWSYRLEDLDVNLHRAVIIKSILNSGDTKSIAWLKDTYAKTEIQTVIKTSTVGDWTKKSLGFVSAMYDTTPKARRF